MKLYDLHAQEALELMLRKNHHYDEELVSDEQSRRIYPLTVNTNNQVINREQMRCHARVRRH